MSHTPGPWTSLAGVMIDGADGKTICMMSPMRGVEVEVIRADSNLIAAAPELLDALAYLVSEARSHGAIDCGDHCSNKCLWCKATRVIAKAEGRP